MDTLGRRLKDLREESDVTLEYVANKVGTTKVSISRYEKDEREPKGEMLNQLADFFNVTTDYLLCRSDIKNTGQPSVVEELSPEIKTIISNLKSKDITPEKAKLINNLIDALFIE